MSYKNVVYEWNSICDHLGGKVAKEPMTEFAEDLIAHETGFAGEYEEGDDWVEEEEVPQHVIDEALADDARQRARDLRQMEMYDDEMWNWSGLR